MTSPPKNWTPSWRSFQQTGNPDDIVSAPTVAAALGQKVDANGGQASGLALDDSSTWDGHSISDLLPSATPTALATLNESPGVRDGSLSSAALLPGDLSASTGTGIVRVEVYEEDSSEYGQAMQASRLIALSRTLRTWAREEQARAKMKALLATMGIAA